MTSQRSRTLSCSECAVFVLTSCVSSSTRSVTLYRGLRCAFPFPLSQLSELRHMTQMMTGKPTAALQLAAMHAAVPSIAALRSYSGAAASAGKNQGASAASAPSILAHLRASEDTHATN